MELVQVQPNDIHLHDISVSSKDQVIKWSFNTQSHNICFGLYRRRREDEPIPSPPTHREPKQRQMSFQSDITSPNQQVKDDTESTYAQPSNQSIHSTNTNESRTPGRPRSKSHATLKLQETGLIEVIPIADMQSWQRVVEGEYKVKEPGIYVLVFDNSFSQTKSKRLTYTVNLGRSPVNEDYIQKTKDHVSGWLLKKRRKKMQGWAKRWFSLSEDGNLSYSTSENGITRGSIQIPVATISYIAKQRQIHIDSGTTIFHIKALTEEDYTQWGDAFKSVRPHIDNRPSVSFSNTSNILKRMPSPINGLYYSGILAAENKIMSAHIEQGIANATTLQQHIKELMTTTDFIVTKITNDSHEVEQNLLKLKQQVQQVLLDAADQTDQWQKVKLNQQNINSGYRSGSASPGLILDENPPQTEIEQDGTITEHTELIRTPSTYSHMSSYSEQFFDAEDIYLSADEGEDEYECAQDDGTSNNDSSENEYAESQRNSFDVSSFSFINDISRRDKLPSFDKVKPDSIVTILRNSIGKDLSNIPMPVNRNEPISVLQRACEELEYCELLETAATQPTSMDRLVYIVAFSVSSYASTQYRGMDRKPFSPMMAETYENIRPDKGFRFISEKVSHKPLIIAAHAESKSYKYWQSTTLKSQFWGKSIEFTSEGVFHVMLTANGKNEHYTFEKPTSKLPISWFGNKTAIVHYGPYKINNLTTGEYADVNFEEKNNKVSATLYNQNDQKVRRITGKWSDQLVEEVNMNPKTLKVIWKAHSPGIRDYEKYFGFTRFATELNEVTELERDRLPITDSRLRPDQLLYEHGKAEEADEEKIRIEQQQRDKRKEFEDANVPWLPHWFIENEEGDWVYNEQYWQARESSQWPDDIFPLW